MGLWAGLDRDLTAGNMHKVAANSYQNHTTQDSYRSIHTIEWVIDTNRLPESKIAANRKGISELVIQISELVNRSIHFQFHEFMFYASSSFYFIFFAFLMLEKVQTTPLASVPFCLLFMGIPTFYGVVLKLLRFPQLPFKNKYNPMHFKSNTTYNV